MPPMFNVGDLVRFKPSGIVRTRYNPNKKLGIVIKVERNVFMSYNGTREDMIEVVWLPSQQRERMMEFYLEMVEE
jgi:hypothetical protein